MLCEPGCWATQQSVIDGLHGKNVFSLGRNDQIAFWSSFPTLHSQEKWRSTILLHMYLTICLQMWGHGDRCTAVHHCCSLWLSSDIKAGHVFWLHLSFIHPCWWHVCSELLSPPFRIWLLSYCSVEDFLADFESPCESGKYFLLVGGLSLCSVNIIHV